MIQHAQSLSRALTIATVMSLIATAGWSQQPSITWLSTLGGGFSAAFGVSANGSVVVGLARDADGYDRAFRWTVAGGMQDLGTLGGDLSQASGVSADGTVAVGRAATADGQFRAFRWTPSGGMQALDASGEYESVAWGVSADGTAVVGAAATGSDGQSRAFRWTAAGGMQDLGTLPDGNWSEAYSVSGDGSVVVGWAESIDRRIEVQIRAFRWTPLGGMEDLNRTYARLLTDGSILIAAYGISSDGRYIVGMGYNAATERTEAYLLDTIPEPASLIALGAGLVGLFTRRRKR